MYVFRITIVLGVKEQDTSPKEKTLKDKVTIPIM